MNDSEIDINKLSQRELLIVTHKKVTEIVEAVEKLTERQTKHEVRISLVEGRVAFFGAVFGIVGAAVLQLITLIFK